MKLRTFLKLVFLLALSSPCAALYSLVKKGAPFLETRNVGGGWYFFRPKNTMLRFTPKEIEEISRKIAKRPWDLLEESYDPLRRLAHSCNSLERVRQSLRPNIKSLVEDYYEEYHQVIEQFCDYDDENPLFLLEECRSRGCPLHRRKDPQKCPREKMSEFICSIPNPGTSIIFYSPGGCFFEASVLERLKMQAETFDKIILIEPLFKPYFSFLSKKNINHSYIDELDLLSLPPSITILLLRTFQWLALVPQLEIYGDINDYLQHSKMQKRTKLVVAMDFVDTSLDDIQQTMQKLKIEDLLDQGIAPDGYLVYGLERTIGIIEKKAQTVIE